MKNIIDVTNEIGKEVDLTLKTTIPANIIKIQFYCIV